MKTTILFLLISFVSAFAQPDETQIIVNVRDNAKLQYNGSGYVKQKFLVISYSPISSGTKHFMIRGLVQMYQNNGGSYGAKITDVILADNTLSNEEKLDLLDRYKDRPITYTTEGKWCDASGNTVASDAVGAIPELQYWQTFKLNHASLNMTSASTQGALDAEYKIIMAIVAKLNSRKNF